MRISAATRVTATCTPVAVIALAAKVTSPLVLVGRLVEAERGVGRVLSSSQVTGTVSTCAMTATTADSPSIIRGCARIAEMAPSRISPRPSGRSGMMPGFGGRGGGGG